MVIAILTGVLLLLGLILGVLFRIESNLAELVWHKKIKDSLDRKRGMAKENKK